MGGARGSSGRSQQRRVRGTGPARQPRRAVLARGMPTGQAGALGRMGGPRGVNRVVVVIEAAGHACLWWD